MFVGVAGYALRYRNTLLLLAVGLCFEIFYDLGVRYSLKFLIDAAVLGSDIRVLALIIALLGAGAVVFHFVVIGCDYVWARTGGRILNDIRLELFGHLQKLPIGYYHRTQPGDLTARFNADVGLIESGMVLAFPMALMGMVEIAVTLALMLSLNAVLCGVAAVGILVSLAIPRLFQERALEASFLLRREEGRMAGAVQENLAGQTIVKAYGLESHASREFALRLDGLLVRLARANFLSYLVSRLPSLSFLLLELVVLGIGGWLTIQGRISVGGLVAYQALLIGLNAAIYNLTWMVPSFIDASAGWRRIREILDEPVRIRDRPDARELTRRPRTIELDRVTFRYPGAGLPALDRVSLHIGAGEHVVLVGRSGAGKSSVINLIMRFYEADEGGVLIDGVDVRELKIASLRERIGLVTQEVMLFDVSVRENIRLGALDATDEQIEEAARAAEIHDLIMSLPAGYETPAGTGGSRFSGGERQRIALARALVRRPAILVLDEFSSALDPSTEADIVRTIERLRGECTIVTVTHRLAMAESADRNIVLRNGRVVEEGTHDELIARRGEYARLWRRGAAERRGAPESPQLEPAR